MTGAIEATTKPSFSKSEAAAGRNDILKMVDSERDTELTRLSDTIKKLTASFLIENNLRSLYDQKKQNKLYASQKDSKKTPTLTIPDFDELIQQAKQDLEAKLRGNEQLIPIRTKIANIQAMIRSWNSLRNE
jgi:hypothetical protein